MTAKILDGRALAPVIREEVKAEVASLRERGLVPRVDVLLVGDDPASVSYAKSKGRMAKRVDIEFQLHQLPSEATEAEVLELIEQLNQDDAVHGIMVELPMPKHINQTTVMAAVHPLKDIDGVNPLNRGYLASEMEGLFPATPLACMEILARHEINVRGMDAVVVGYGATVGKPLGHMLLHERATTTTCHSRTKDLAAYTRNADLVVAAVGRPGMITADMIKPGAIVVDVAINQTEDGIVGDVDFEAVKEVAGWITPVPGGVGPLTSILIFKNLLKAIKLQNK
ncbi:MAG: bifunctional 5,10-methylenetetrahydrofolate dehydrogenase/5,10-methenyltetrahydrofolate cyclohydrolase [Bacillota bacterium]|jgi:methylenetetrahydrofolate dehydrogenase (NADP+)/methenyltetrahydrofolate cyclohydrolase